jgi:hypothetical protein
MRRRLLEGCLLAYPRERRRRDGVVLRDLALDLGDSHGIAREAASLLRAGLAERITSWSIRRRALIVALVTGAIGTAVLPAAGGRTQLDVEQFACSRPTCGDVTSLVTERQHAGWQCTRSTADDVVRWRCTLP